RHFRSGRKGFLEIAHVDHGHRLAKGVVEPALGNAADEGRRAAFKDLGGRPAGQGALSLVSAATGFAVPGATAAPDALPLLVLLDALVDFGQVHDRVTPRSRSTSCRGRRSASAAMVA